MKEMMDTSGGHNPEKETNEDSGSSWEDLAEVEFRSQVEEAESQQESQSEVQESSSNEEAVDTSEPEVSDAVPVATSPESAADAPMPSASVFMDKLNQNHRNIESYGSEVMGKKIEEFAQDYLDNEAYLQGIVAELAGEGDDARDLDSISSEEIIRRCEDDRKAAVKRHNDLNNIMHDLRQSTNFFTSRFGKKARQLKEYQKEQDDCYNRVNIQDKRLSLVKSLLGIEDKK